MPRNSLVVLAVVTVFYLVFSCPSAVVAADGKNSAKPDSATWRPRLEKSLDRWCRWLSGYLYQIPGTDLYTLNPTLGTGNNPYRDVAGNQFAAAAAGYWLKKAQPDEKIARPLRGLIKLALGTHVAIKEIDRPDIQKWGATISHADDWHADLFAVAEGMLLIDALPPDRKEQLRKILAWEADKQVEFGISKEKYSMPALWPEHSHGEANAWSTTLLQMARLAWPESNRQEAWRNSAIDYSLNAICVPADMTSDKVVGGKPLKERVKGANFEPGGIQEHHGFYHPGYEGWPLAYQAYAYVMDQQLPESLRNPDVYLNNWKYVFDRIKQATFSNGRFIHCAGDDWITYGYGNTQFYPAAIFAAAHFKDSDAALMADQWISLIEKQQDLSDGGILAVRLATLRRLRMNDYSWYEGQEGCCLAQALWLLDRLDEKAFPAPATDEEYNRRNVGTYYEPNVRMAWCRDEHRWASSAWRCAFGEWQMIVQPVGLPHLLKYNHNSMGILDITGTNGSTPPKLEWYKMGTFEKGGFWSIGGSSRESKTILDGYAGSKNKFPLVQQYQGLIALPEGPSIFVDFCQAVDQIWLLRTGSLGMRLAADVYTDNQVKLTVGGKERDFSQAPCRDLWHDLGDRSVTVEKLLTIHALSGEGTFQLLQKRQRPADASEILYTKDPFSAEESLLTHELYFGPPAYSRPRIVSPKEWFRKDVLIFYCDPAHTPAKPAGQVNISGEFPCLTIELPEVDGIVAINFSTTEQSGESSMGRVSIGPQSAKVIR